MRRVADIMGMPVTIDVGETRAISEIIDQAYTEFRRMDELLSPFKVTSQVSLINAGDLRMEEADPLVRLAADTSKRYEQATGGYFSAWVGGRFDPSGVVKALAIDRACSILDASGCTDYLVDAGGDCRVRGNSESGRPWRVGIRHPVERDKVACVLSVVDAAVATSGTYEKGDHIIDPLTGDAVRELLSVSDLGFGLRFRGGPGRLSSQPMTRWRIY